MFEYVEWVKFTSVKKAVSILEVVVDKIPQVEPDTVKFQVNELRYGSLS